MTSAYEEEQAGSDTSASTYQGAYDTEYETDAEQVPNKKPKGNDNTLTSPNEYRRSSRQVDRSVLYDMSVHPQDAELEELESDDTHSTNPMEPLHDSDNSDAAKNTDKENGLREDISPMGLSNTANESDTDENEESAVDGSRSVTPVNDDQKNARDDAHADVYDHREEPESVLEHEHVYDQEDVVNGQLVYDQEDVVDDNEDTQDSDEWVSESDSWASDVWDDEHDQNPENGKYTLSIMISLLHI
jgi:hypothetical protein